MTSSLARSKQIIGAHHSVWMRTFRHFFCNFLIFWCSSIFK